MCKEEYGPQTFLFALRNNYLDIHTYIETFRTLILRNDSQPEIYYTVSKLEINTAKTKICIFGRGADWHPFPCNHSILYRKSSNIQVSRSVAF